MRRLSCCIALVLMLCMSGAAFAQTMPPTYCGDLSQEDCDILNNATTATAALDSALYDLTFDLNITNVPDLNEPVNFNMTGSGSFAGMAALQSSMMSMTDMSAMQGDPTQMMQMMGDLLRGLNADVNLTFNFPAVLVDEANGQLPDSLTLQARMVDGFAYLNTDTLASLLRGSSMNVSGWYGIDLASFFAAYADQMSGMMDSMGDMTPSTDMMENMEHLNDPEFIGRFASVTRIDDGTSDTAMFQFNIDLGAMMGSPEFQNMIREQMASQAEMMGSSSMDEDEMNQAMAMVTQMFKGITFVMTEEIGLDDGFVHRINGAMSFDTAGMMAAMGSMGATSSSNDEVPPVINITFSVGYSSFNTAPLVTAPEDATIIPYQMLLGSDMSGMEMTPTMTVAAATVAAPTAMPTTEATSEATVEPTSEVTAEPTDVVTPEPTVEVTVEVPPVPTLEPTVEVTVQT